MRHKLFIIPAAFIVLALAVSYVAIDDLNYRVDPENIIHPLSDEDVFIWKDYTNILEQLSTCITNDIPCQTKGCCNPDGHTFSSVSLNSFMDMIRFEKWLNHYLSIGTHPSLKESTLSLLDEPLSYKNFRDCSRFVCKYYSELMHNKEFSEAERVISNHIIILQNLRDEARTYRTFTLATVGQSRAFAVIDQHKNDFPEKMRLRLIDLIEKRNGPSFEQILKREYALTMKLYSDVVTNRLPGVWMPKDTANLYTRTYQQTLKVYDSEGSESAGKTQDTIQNKSLLLRNIIGRTYIIETSLPSFHKLKLNFDNFQNERIELMQELKKAKQNQLVDPIVKTPVD